MCDCQRNDVGRLEATPEFISELKNVLKVLDREVDELRLVLKARGDHAYRVLSEPYYDKTGMAFLEINDLGQFRKESDSIFPIPPWSGITLPIVHTAHINDFGAMKEFLNIVRNRFYRGLSLIQVVNDINDRILWYIAKQKSDMLRSG